jgi:hypothetical protein
MANDHCSTCGTEFVKASARFCAQCGAPRASERIRGQDPIAEPETPRQASPTVAIGPWAIQLLNAALGGIEEHGEQAAFWQVFDADPDNADAPADVRHQKLGLDEARSAIGARVQAGFQGVAGCVFLREEEGKLVLRAEAYDTRDQRSIGLYVGLKRTWKGNLSFQGGNAVIDHIPTVPGILGRSD